MTTTTASQRLRDLIRDHYVLPEQAARIADGLGEVNVPDDSAAQVFAERATARLRELSTDRHLSVRHRPAGVLQPTEGAEYRRRYQREAVRNAGGISSVQRRADGVGLLAIAPYLSPVPMAVPYIDAAFALLAGVQRLVIDLREGRGGTPESVAYLCGYLLGDESVHLQDVVDRDGSGRPFWTSPRPGRLDLQVPVAVLTSTGTFSGCEELGYNLQAHGRARIIGETTGGGAHPCQAFPLTDVLEVSVPVARSVNAVTGTNWEGVGVRPDVECPAADALDRALAAL